jgi:hypothetical protein
VARRVDIARHWHARRGELGSAVALPEPPPTPASSVLGVDEI